MSIIKSPFNFVPLSGKVFFPDWAGKISQDIPFSDGLSGMIRLKITADSPIYIRNGHVREDAPDKKTGEFKTKEAEKRYISFSHVDVGGEPRYFIPGTSIKGEVRNLLEIMSFGKMQMDPHSQFAVRDLNNKKLYNILDSAQQHKIMCGWMIRKKDFSGYTIESCGRPMRISQQEIDRYLGKPVLVFSFSTRDKGLNLPDSKKSATYKYSLVEPLHKPLKGLRFSQQPGVKRRDKAVQLVYDPNGSIKGTIVMTGQSGKWQPRDVSTKGKMYEFVFPNKGASTYELSNETFELYKFIYEGTEDWKRFLKSLSTPEGAPVFFRTDDNEPDRLKDFGLAYLYKMPYTNSVKDSLPSDHLKSVADLAQCIFGFTETENVRDRDKVRYSLKGRVQFGNAFADPSTVRMLDTQRLPLGTPKASYLPIYVSQGKAVHGQLPVSYTTPGKNGEPVPHYTYQTYDNSHPTGWKRYYGRDGIVWGEPAPVNSEGEDTQNTPFDPLDTGAVFNGVVTFHNLRPIELGALLCALTFGGHQDCHHQLGLAKPYGYGLCHYETTLAAQKLSNLGGEAITETNGFINSFIQKIADELSLKDGWSNDASIKTLLTMASIPVPDSDGFRYMNMSTDRNKNDFLNAKKEGETLRPSLELLEGEKLN